MNKKNIGKRCEVLLGSADNLPLEDNSIKLSIAFETMYSWEDLEKCFAEVKIILKPDKGIKYKVQDENFVSDDEIKDFIFDHILVHFDIDVLDERFFH